MKKAHTVIFLLLYFFLPTSVAIAEGRNLIQSIRDLDEPFKSGYVDFKCKKDSYEYGSAEIIFSIKKEFLGYRVRIKQDLNWIEVPLVKELNELGFEFKVTEKVEGKDFIDYGFSFDDDIANKFLWLNFYEQVKWTRDGKYTPHVKVKKKTIENSLHVRIDFMSRKMKTSEIFVDDKEMSRVRIPAQLNWDRSINELVQTKSKIERLRDELLAELREMEAVPNLYFGTYGVSEKDKDSKLSIYNIAYGSSFRKKITEMLKVSEPFLQDFDLLDEAQSNGIIPYGFSKDLDVTFKGRFAADAYEEIRLTRFPDDTFVQVESGYSYTKHSKEKIAAYFDLLEIHLNNTIQFAMMEIDFLLANTDKLPEDHVIAPYVQSVDWKGFKLSSYATYNCALIAD